MSLRIWKTASGLYVVSEENPETIEDFHRSSESDIRRIGSRLAQYVYDEEIDSVMFVDRSARPGHIALREAWKRKFPGKKLPDIYFTNPDGHSGLYRSREEIVEEFNSTYTKLARNKNQKVLVFDVCLHTGESIGPILSTLKQAGYQNVRSGLSQPKDKRFDCEIKPSFEALNYTPRGGCLSLGSDRLVEKYPRTVVSKRSYFGRDYREHSLEIRRKIKNAFRETN